MLPRRPSAVVFVCVLMCTLVACSHVQTRPDMRDRAAYVLAQLRLVVSFVDLSLPLAVEAGLVGANVQDYYVSVLRPQVSLVFSALSTALAALEASGGSDKVSALEVAIEQAEQVLRLIRDVVPPAVPV